MMHALHDPATQHAAREVSGPLRHVLAELVALVDPAARRRNRDGRLPAPPGNPSPPPKADPAPAPSARTERARGVERPLGHDGAGNVRWDESAELEYAESRLVDALGYLGDRKPTRENLDRADNACADAQAAFGRVRGLRYPTDPSPR